MPCDVVALRLFSQGNRKVLIGKFRESRTRSRRCNPDLVKNKLFWGKNTTAVQWREGKKEKAGKSEDLPCMKEYSF